MHHGQSRMQCHLKYIHPNMNILSERTCSAPPQAPLPKQSCPALCEGAID